MLIPTATTHSILRKSGLNPGVYPDPPRSHRLFRPSEADFFYETALQLDPVSPVANLRFGVFLKALGENAKARVHLECALNLDATYEDARTALAQLE
jgi:hypothetical protein